jgi:type IV secretory pathway VirB2 component (pilin)
MPPAALNEGKKGFDMLTEQFHAAAAALMLSPTRANTVIRTAVSACFRKARALDARQVATFAAAATVLAMAADPAFAQAGGGGQGDITTFLQNLVNIITGTAGKLIAVLAICIVGVGALMGALSMRAAGGVILGVLLIFSSAWIVNQIIGQ